MATHISLIFLGFFCLTLTECVIRKAKEDEIRAIPYLLPRRHTYFGDISSVHVSENGADVGGFGIFRPSHLSAGQQALASSHHAIGAIQQALGSTQQELGASQQALGASQQALGASHQISLSALQQAFGAGQQAQGSASDLYNMALQLVNNMGQHVHSSPTQSPISTAAPQRSTTATASQSTTSTAASQQSTTATGNWAVHPYSSVNCHDNIPTCLSYGPDMCVKYPDWAKQQCAQFCVFCINTASSKSAPVTTKPTTTVATHGNGGAIP